MPNRHQNPNRWTEQDRRDRMRDDDINWNDRDHNRDESRSWAGDRDLPRSQGYRQQGAGQYARDDDARAYGDRGDWGSRTAQDQTGYGAQRYEPSRSYASGETWGRGQGWLDQAPRAGEFGRDYGVNRAYGQRQTPAYDQGRDHEAHGYAPGSQIWEGSDREPNRSRYEPDYLHWRDQQVQKFDRDYDDWRSERRQKFSSDFDSWRTNRADNPIVGDVADGGVGSQRDLKKS